MDLLELVWTMLIDRKWLFKAGVVVVALLLSLLVVLAIYNHDDKVVWVLVLLIFEAVLLLLLGSAKVEIEDEGGLPILTGFAAVTCLFMGFGVLLYATEDAEQARYRNAKQVDSLAALWDVQGAGSGLSEREYLVLGRVSRENAYGRGECAVRVAADGYVRGPSELRVELADAPVWVRGYGARYVSPGGGTRECRFEECWECVRYDDPVVVAGRVERTGEEVPGGLEEGGRIAKGVIEATLLFNGNLAQYEAYLGEKAPPAGGAWVRFMGRLTVVLFFLYLLVFLYTLGRLMGRWWRRRSISH